MFWDVDRITHRPRPKSIRLSPQENESLWTDLADADAAKAYRAIRAFSTSPTAAAFLGERLHPARAARQDDVDRWIADLDSDDFDAGEGDVRSGRRGRRGRIGAAKGRRRTAVGGSPFPSGAAPEKTGDASAGSCCANCERWRRWNPPAGRRRGRRWSGWPGAPPSRGSRAKRRRRWYGWADDAAPLAIWASLALSKSSPLAGILSELRTQRSGVSDYVRRQAFFGQTEFVRGW